MPERLSARQLVDLVLDEGSWVSWDTAPVREGTEEPDEAYAAQLVRAADRSGADESVLTGEARLAGRRVAVVLGEFGFLAGSVGRATARRLRGAIGRATAEGLPLLAAPVSGGTRMQEGVAAFVQMAPIAAALAAHRGAGLPYLVWLRHPTTGGVMASWGSLGHATAVEPGALVGFLGPRVFEALHGEPFPEGVQTGENLREHGVVDGVLRPEELRPTLRTTLSLLCDRVLDRAPGPADERRPPAPAPSPPRDAGATWEVIRRSRADDRPGLRELLRHGAGDVVVLSGTGEGERDAGVTLALARFGTTSCVVVGHDRAVQRADGPFGPAGLRTARRGIRLAEELSLPLVSVVDTGGAELSVAAEQGSMAGEIARTLAALTSVPVATVSLVLGQGNGGGALALLPADRVLATASGWVSPLPPEGASVIVHRDTDHAAEMAHAQGVSATAMHAVGLVDRVVEEPDGGPGGDPAGFCRTLAVAIAAGLEELDALPPGERLARRLDRYG